MAEQGAADWATERHGTGQGRTGRGQQRSVARIHGKWDSAGRNLSRGQRGDEVRTIVGERARLGAATRELGHHGSRGARHGNEQRRERLSRKCARPSEQERRAGPSQGRAQHQGAQRAERGAEEDVPRQLEAEQKNSSVHGASSGRRDPASYSRARGMARLELNPSATSRGEGRDAQGRETGREQASLKRTAPRLEQELCSGHGRQEGGSATM